MAERVHDDAASVARLGYFTDLGQAQRDRDVALAGTEVTQAKIDALKNVQLFDADAYDPMRPLFPVKPQQYPWAVDEVLAEDYEVREWSVAGGYDPVKKLFKHPTPSEREEFVIPEWLRPYTGNRVHDEFTRQTDSWAGYVLAVADGNGGIYIDNNNQQQTTQNQNGPSGQRPQVEDPVLRVNLRTPDIVHDFHTYFRDYARLGGSVSKDAADMWIHFEAIGLSDSRAFSAYGHPSTDAMLHFYENVRPIVVTSNSQDDTGVGGGTGAGAGGTQAAGGGGNQTVPKVTPSPQPKPTDHASRPKRDQSTKPLTRGNTTATAAANDLEAKRAELKYNLRAQLGKGVTKKQGEDFVSGVAQGFLDALKERLRISPEITSRFVRWPSKAVASSSVYFDGLGRPSYRIYFGTVP